MFDLVDYKALAGKTQHILFDTFYIQILKFFKQHLLHKSASVSPLWGQYSVSAEFTKREDIVKNIRTHQFTPHTPL